MFNIFRKKMDITEVFYKYNALIDTGSNTLLVIGRDFQIMSYLSEYILDSFVVGIPVTNRINEKFYDMLFNSKECYEYKWNQKMGMVEKNKNQTDSLKAKSMIAFQKYKYLSSISKKIEDIRHVTKRTMLFQETIYLAKKYQADRFKDKGYPDGDILDYPYVLQYADYKNISYKQAAEAIIFKAKMSDSLLARSESLRLKYFNRIKDAKSKEEIEKTYADFMLDFDVRI